MKNILIVVMIFYYGRKMMNYLKLCLNCQDIKNTLFTKYFNKYFSIKIQQ